MNNGHYYGAPLNGGYAINDNAVLKFIESATEEMNVPDIFRADGKPTIKMNFENTLRGWVYSSTLNKVRGLGDFHYSHYVNGTSEAFSQFLLRHNKKRLRFFTGEFVMHRISAKNAGIDWLLIDEENPITSIRPGDAVIISCPFSDFGVEHPEHTTLMEHCEENSVPVLVDMAYFGMCRFIEIDLSYSCIEEVTFSLGKTFPVIGARIGARFQRREFDDAVTFANQSGIVNNYGRYLGELLCKNFTPDYIPSKYSKVQERVCRELDITESKCILFALSKRPEFEKWNRGNKTTRLCISKLIEEEYGNQFNY